jgi:hypothetical protein
MSASASACSTFEILLGTCASDLVLSEADANVQASGGAESYTEAVGQATQDVDTTLATQPSQCSASCTGFSQLAGCTTFSDSWWGCLGGVIESYAIWIAVFLVVLILLYAWVNRR